MGGYRGARYDIYITMYKLQGMGYNQSIVEESLKQQKFDDCYASYLLLGRRNTDVSKYFMTFFPVETRAGLRAGFL